MGVCPNILHLFCGLADWLSSYIWPEFLVAAGWGRVQFCYLGITTLLFADDVVLFLMMHVGPVVLTRAVGNQVSSSRKEWIEVLPQMGEFKYWCHTHDWGSNTASPIQAAKICWVETYVSPFGMGWEVWSSARSRVRLSIDLRISHQHHNSVLFFVLCLALKEQFNIFW